MNPPNRSRPADNGAAESQTATRDELQSTRTLRPTLASCPQPWKPFDAHTRELIQRGDVRGAYVGHDGATDWPSIVASVALRLRNHGRDLHEYLDTVTNPDHAVSQWYRKLRRERGHKRAEAWLIQRWHMAGRRPPPNRPSLAVETIEAFLADANQRHDWKGKAGATDRAVLHVHARRALKFGGTVYSLSVRDMADNAGCQRRTASRATHRLIDRELVNLVRAGDVERASLYRLNVKAGHKRTTTTSPSGGLGSGALLTAHDAFRWSALGKNAQAVYAVLTEDQQSTVEISRALSVAPRTTRRCLRRLEEHRLVIEVESGQWVRGYADPNGAALKFGTFGRTLFEQFRHEHERHVWRGEPCTCEAGREVAA